MTAVLAGTVVLVGALPRILLAAGVLPAALRPLVWSDVLHLWEREGAALPYWESWFEYPPLTGYLAGALTLLASSSAVYVALWAAVQALAAAATAWLLAREAGARRALLWAAAPQLALLGPVNFDLLAVFALVAAVALMRRSRPGAAAVAIAAGTLFKLFTAALLGIELIRAGRRAGVAAAGFALVVAALYLPAATARFSALGAVPLYAVSIRANLDSPWGLARSALLGVGVPGADVIVLAGSTAALLVLYARFALAHARARDAAAPAALAVLGLLLASRLYSPQYSLWALPFFALLALPVRAYALLLVADAAVFLTVYPLTLIRWEGDAPLRTLMVAVLAAAVVARHAALVLAFLAASRLARGVSEPGAGCGAPAASVPPIHQARRAGEGGVERRAGQRQGQALATRETTQ